MSTTNSKPNLTDAENEGIIQFLLSRYKTNGKPKLGSLKEASNKFGVTDRTIRTIWSRARQQREQGTCPIVLTSRKKSRVRLVTKPFDKDKFKEIPYQKKRNFRSIARAMGVCKTTVQRWFKQGKIRAHTNAIKPSLSDQNKVGRIKFCLDHIVVNTEEKMIKFQEMQQTIHIDEKWFYITNANERYYLTPDEEEPYRHTQSKRFITKAMFLCVVARPFYDAITGECLFDGKIGIIMQQDNAKPHIQDSDLEFRQVADSDGFNIHLVNQPPNSPDSNINDLGWFRALQSLQVETAAYNLDELLGAVTDSFNDLSHTKLNFVFLSLQACMIEILKVKGSNNYKLPHIKKESLMRAGMLPKVLEVSKEVVKDAIDFLVENNQGGGLEQLIHDVAKLF